MRDEIEHSDSEFYYQSREKVDAELLKLPTYSERTKRKAEWLKIHLNNLF